MIEPYMPRTIPSSWGVQWHPEHLTTSQPDAAKLFAAFVDACR